MISTPQEDIVLPEDVKRGIERARNNVTVMEAEYERLKGLVISLQYTVGEAHKELTELNEKVAGLKGVVEQYEVDRVLLMNEVDALTKDKALILSEIAGAKSEHEARMEGVATRLKAIEERESALLHMTTVLSETSAELTTRQNAIEIREEKVKQFAESL